MNKHVHSIAGRLSLRAPQRRSLEILDRITEIASPHTTTDKEAVLQTIRSEFPTVADFEREFPSVCFALATGVGKTRLMGAFISYLYLAHDIRNFFVLAPNLTIYNKLITDFTPNTPKYVFTGIAEFATEPPTIITGDNYDQAHTASSLFPVRINIFNISKINSEVRGGKAPRIKRLSEYIGQSYYDYLAELKDLVLIMDESHRYRASAGVRAINELYPVLGLELTATPIVETGKGPIPFKNVIYDYPLGKAMVDGFVKDPAVVTRKDFSALGMTPEEIERLKLEDGIHLHESVKVELETYARETGNRIVKPFVLIIARDTTHASQLLHLIKDDSFFEGRYKDKVIQVDSSKTGAEEEEMIVRLLAVERNEEPTEIVIHVNMLKEGWDVTNLYTIIPLRAANARTLIEQSIGRGLRLPYGKRTGVASVDRLNIIAHDKFQEIVDEANRSDSPIRLQQIVLSAEQLAQKTESVISVPGITAALGISPVQSAGMPSETRTSSIVQPLFKSREEQRIAQCTYEAIQKLSRKRDVVPASSYLIKPEIQEQIVKEVSATLPLQLELEGIREKIDIAAITAKTSDIYIRQTIDIPRILVVPKSEVKSGYRQFNLDVSSLNYPAPSEELWVQHLRNSTVEIIGVGDGGVDESRLEDYIVRGLIDFDDICYDDHADLLYDLASQTVKHFLTYITEDETRKVLKINQRTIARLIHAQMQNHYWEEPVDFEVVVSQGFTELKESAYSVLKDETYCDIHDSPSVKRSISRYLFTGFKRCLYPAQKFHSDTERKLAIILDREAHKWFRPAKGQLSIFYKNGHDHLEYQPDFVAETENTVYLLEAKAKTELERDEVIAKKNAAVTWCKNATTYSQKYGGKPWEYLLIPHDMVTENLTIDILASQFRYS
ncbi:MAG: DEAD/DEAH box helicase [Fibrobacterota bacterium]|nr:DEAD/DEAH box helicase family protein [Chitinispirillaceae bacterium]